MKAVLSLLLGQTILAACFSAANSVPDFASVAFSPSCSPEVVGKAMLGGEWVDGIAHTVHSMTVEGLRLFNPKASELNSVPTVNLNLSAPLSVLPYAPAVPVSGAFTTPTMNLIDTILSTLGTQSDGLGPAWSSTERIVHQFHMRDLWNRIHEVFLALPPPDMDVCDCLLDTASNGVAAKVAWVAEHYKSGTPITLLDRPIPKLQDASSWAVWKERLLHYYDAQQLHNSAKYLQCATK